MSPSLWACERSLEKKREREKGDLKFSPCRDVRKDNTIQLHVWQFLKQYFQDMERGVDCCKILRRQMCFHMWLTRFYALVCGEQRALYESQLLSVKHCLSHMHTKQIDVAAGIPGIQSININQERSEALVMESR